jgi:hypothetical protein
MSIISLIYYLTPVLPQAAKLPWEDTRVVVTIIKTMVGIQQPCMQPAGIVAIPR